MSSPRAMMAAKPEIQRAAYVALSVVAVVSIALAAFDLWVGSSGTKAPSWAFVALAIIGAVGIAAAIFRVVSVPREFFLALVPALVAGLYFYIGTSADKSPKWAFTTLAVVGFVKGISAIAVLVFALSSLSSIKSS